jgi:hypothetical protein
VLQYGQGDLPLIDLESVSATAMPKPVPLVLAAKKRKKAALFCRLNKRKTCARWWQVQKPLLRAVSVHGYAEWVQNNAERLAALGLAIIQL